MAAVTSAVTVIAIQRKEVFLSLSNFTKKQDEGRKNFKKMHSSSVTFFIFFTLLFQSIATVVSTTIGVTYSAAGSGSYGGVGGPASRRIPPEKISAKVTSMEIPAVRIIDSDPAMIRSFAYTNVSLLLSIPNQVVPQLAANRSLAMRWVYRHVLPFHPRSKISIISVGNDVISSSPDISPFLIPAIQNIYLSLRDLSIKKVSVSTTFSFFNIISTAFPPSMAQFEEPAGAVIIKPLLQFLDSTNSSFLVNIYPYNMYRANSEIPIVFALFQEHPFNFRDDLTTGVRYRNLFDMMVDAVISSMAVMGHENVPLIVTETGWPSSGADPGEVDATPLYAEMYLRGLIRHLRSGIGTPLRKEGVAEAYIYDLVDKVTKQGSRNWGILYQNMTRKYCFELSAGDKKVCGSRSVPVGILLGMVMLLLMY